MSLKELFKPGIIRPKIGGRVRHKASRQLGTVEGRAKIGMAYVLTVKYDDGLVASMIPENEFIAVDANTPAVRTVKAVALIKMDITGGYSDQISDIIRN